MYWKSSDLGSEELEFSSESELGESVSTKREQILKLMEAGLLTDSLGKISNSMRVKILELFGLGVWDGTTDESVLQKNYAEGENFKMVENKPVEVLEIHNHEIHINRHIAFMLDKDFENASKVDANLKQKFLEHIKEHKKQL